MTDQISQTSPIPGVDAVRADGGLVRIRPLGASDSDEIRALFARASDRSIFLRFFSAGRHSVEEYLPALLRRPDASHRALVASIAGEIVGVADYERQPADGPVAEVALLVADSRHHEGIGTLLLEHLAATARAEGVQRFVADALTENTAVLGVLRGLGYTLHARSSGDTVEVAFDLQPTPTLLAAVDAREQSADAASLRPLLAPRSIAVVGASERPDAVGHQVLRNILAGGFTGTVYAVNPKHGSVLGVPSSPTVAELPETPDLAVIAVPAAQVASVVQACGERGVHGLLMLTAGFGETGSDGRARQAEALDLARHHGMRLIGPNCLGLLNTDPAIRLNATFAPLPMESGGLGLVSQSGALGIAVLAAAARSGLGVAQFVSVGNKADVSSNDLLLAWEQDDRVRVITLYLESFGNPRKFARIARRVGRRKPVIAIKAGRSAAGQQAGQSHTAAAAASDTVVDALFTEAGVLRVDTMEQMLDVARLLDSQPLPGGPRVAVVGNSGGPGILAADAAAAAGLDVVDLAPDTVRALGTVAPGAASCRNPVDLGAAVEPDRLVGAVHVLLAAPEVDAVLVVYTEIATVSADEAVNRVADSLSTAEKPVVITRVGAASGTLRVPGAASSVPVYSFPEPAAAALAVAHRYSRIRRAETAPVGRPEGLDTDGAYLLIRDALSRGVEWLGPEDTARLLTQYGLPLSPQRIVTDPDAAVAAAAELGYPLAVKLADGGLHKTDIGGVRLGIADPQALRDAVTQMQAAHAGVRLLLQPMAAEGVEVIVGAVQHAQFGPLVMAGAGGVLADLVADRVFRLAPLAQRDAESMLGAMRTARVLDGYRGRPAVSRPALAELITRVSLLVDDQRGIAELDLNPVVCNGDRLVVVDARVRIAEPPAEPDPLLRRLR